MSRPSLRFLAICLSLIAPSALSQNLHWQASPWGYSGVVAGGGSGDVTGVALTAPAAGLTITGSPCTTGDCAMTFALANDLAGLEGLGSTGIAVRTGDGTWVVRTITAPAAGVTVADGGGVAGNPTLALANDLAALEALAAAGLAVRTGADTWTVRSITAGTGISVSNGDGVSGAPTISIADTAVTPGSYTNANITVDQQGRLTAAASGSGVSGGAANRFALWSGATALTYSDAIAFDVADNANPMATITSSGSSARSGLRIVRTNYNKTSGYTSSFATAPFSISATSSGVTTQFFADVDQDGNWILTGAKASGQAGIYLSGGTSGAGSDSAAPNMGISLGGVIILSGVGAQSTFTNTAYLDGNVGASTPILRVRYYTTDLLNAVSTGTTLTAYDATGIPLKVKGAAAQTGNLTEWRNSSGTVLASVSSEGLGTFANAAFGPANGTVAANNTIIGGGTCATCSVRNIGLGSVLISGGGTTDAIAMGYGASVSAGFGIAIGPYATTAYRSTVIGDGTATADYQLVLGGPTYMPIRTSHFGGVVSTSPQAHTINATGGSGTNIAGAALSIAGGKGTGNAAGGTTGFQTSYPGSSGTTLQTLTDRVAIPSKWTTLTESTDTAIATLTYSASTAVGAEFVVTVEARDATNGQAMTYHVAVNSNRDASGNTASVPAVIGTPPVAAGTGTLTCSFTMTEGASAATLNANCVSSLTQTTLRATWQAQANGPVTLAQP